jgi:hypothetical protein
VEAWRRRQPEEGEKREWGKVEKEGEIGRIFFEL